MKFKEIDVLVTLECITRAHIHAHCLGFNGSRMYSTVQTCEKLMKDIFSVKTKTCPTKIFKQQSF